MTPPAVNARARFLTRARARADDVDAATIYINVQPDAYCSLTHGRGSPVRNESEPPLVATDICVHTRVLRARARASSPSLSLSLRLSAARSHAELKKRTRRQKTKRINSRV